MKPVSRKLVLGVAALLVFLAGFGLFMGIRGDGSRLPATEPEPEASTGATSASAAMTATEAQPLAPEAAPLAASSEAPAQTIAKAEMPKTAGSPGPPASSAAAAAPASSAPAASPGPSPTEQQAEPPSDFDQTLY